MERDGFLSKPKRSPKHWPWTGKASRHFSLPHWMKRMPSWMVYRKPLRASGLGWIRCLRIGFLPKVDYRPSKMASSIVCNATTIRLPRCKLEFKPSENVCCVSSTSWSKLWHVCKASQTPWPDSWCCHRVHLDNHIRKRWATWFREGSRWTGFRPMEECDQISSATTLASGTCDERITHRSSSHVVGWSSSTDRRSRRSDP